MYAIIENGNKQYKVQEGDVIRLEKLAASVGDTVQLPVVMLVDEKGVHLGSDVSHAKVEATIEAQEKFRKIIVFKYKAKKNVRKKQGHRQPFTAIKITKISV